MLYCSDVLSSVGSIGMCLLLIKGGPPRTIGATEILMATACPSDLSLQNVSQLREDVGDLQGAANASGAVPFLADVELYESCSTSTEGVCTLSPDGFMATLGFTACETPDVVINNTVSLHEALSEVSVLSRLSGMHSTYNIICSHCLFNKCDTQYESVV